MAFVLEIIKLVNNVMGLCEAINSKNSVVRRVIRQLRKGRMIYNVFCGIVFVICILLEWHVFRVMLSEQCNISDEIIDILYRFRFIACIALTGIQFLITTYTGWKFTKLNIASGKNNREIVSKIHEKFIHNIRNNVFELENTRLELLDIEDKTTAYERLKQDLVSNSRDYVDSLQEILTKYCTSEITVTIKTIDEEDDEYATTLVRSSNTLRSRIMDNERVKLSDNTSFSKLVTGEQFFYGNGNLESAYKSGMYSAGVDYRDWSEKYKSTLVVPIRYNSKVSRRNDTKVELVTLGFLCIDSKEEQDNWERHDSYELSLLAVVADALFIYYKKYYETKTWRRQ